MSGVHLFQAVSWLALLIMIPVSGCASSSDEILAFHAGDAPREILSRHTRIPADGQAASFATGKTLVLLDKPELARLHLEAASRRNDAWTDEALWLLHELARRQNRWGTAAGHLRTIIQRSSGSSWYPRALSAHGTLQVQRKIPTEMPVLLKASAHPAISHTLRGQFLLHAARASSPGLARDFLQQGLSLELYDETGKALTREMLLLAMRIRLTPVEELALAAGMVRSGQERAALTRLSRLDRKDMDAISRLNGLTIRCWIQRRMRDWPAAERTIAEMEREGSAGASRAAQEQRFRLDQGRGSLSGMRSAARAILSIDKPLALFWWKILVQEEKNPLEQIQRTLELLGHWPGEAETERILVDRLIQLFIQRQTGQFLLLARQALPHITERWRKAAILYHLHAAGDATTAEDVSLAEPLGYYHRLLAGSPKNDAPARALLKAPLDWQKLATASFLTSPTVEREILSRMKAQRGTLPNPEILLVSPNIDMSLLAGLLKPDSRSVCRELASAGLWPEALDEILRRHPPGDSILLAQSAEYLINLSRLAGKASRFNVEIWAAWAAIRKTGWQYELAVVERAIGGTVFSRIYPRHFTSEVSRWSRTNRLDPLLVHALIRQESAYNRSVSSWAGAVGLMQLMPSTASGIAGSLGLSRYDLKNPDTNIRFGCSMLRWLRETFGNNEADILIGYNSGPGNIARWKNAYRARWGLEPTLARYTETIPYDETKNYIKLVLSNLMIYRYLYQ